MPLLRFLFAALLAPVLALSLGACSLVHLAGASPQKLFQTLLSTPVQSSELLPGLTSGGNSAGIPDAGARRAEVVGIAATELKLVNPGSVFIPPGEIDYAVFPDRSKAQSALDDPGEAAGPDPRPTSVRGYTGVCYSGAVSATVFWASCSVVANNVIVESVSRGDNAAAVEQTESQLEDAAMRHLLKVKR